MGLLNFFSGKINLLIIGLSVLMMVAVLNLPFKAKPFGDNDIHRESKNAALYLKGKVGYDQLIISKAPGTITYFAIPYLLAPSDATDDQLWYYGVFFNFLIVTLSLLMIFKSATNLFSKEVGLFSVLLMVVFPIHCYYALSIIGETAAFFSFCLAIYGWSKVQQNSDRKLAWILMIFGISFMILNRPNTLLILPIGFLFLGYFYFKRKDFFSKYGKKIVFSLLMSGVIGFASLETAKAITGTKFGHTQQGALNYVLLQGRYQFRNEPTDFRFWDNKNRADSKDYQDWKKKFGELENEIKSTNKSYDEAYKGFIIPDYFENPFLSVRQFVVKCFYGQMYFINSITPDNFKLASIKGPIAYWALILLINSINLLVVIGVFIFLFTSKNRDDYWLFWSIIISLLLFHGLTYMEPRYMFPAKPAFFILGAAGLYRLSFFKKNITKLAKRVT
jgi:4-amino-4-deoxy-L-arabinose transferase-like glycosyltransferase